MRPIILLLLTACLVRSSEAQDNLTELPPRTFHVPQMPTGQQDFRQRQLLDTGQWRTRTTQTQPTAATASRSVTTQEYTIQQPVQLRAYQTQRVRVIRDEPQTHIEQVASPPPALSMQVVPQTQLQIQSQMRMQRVRTQPVKYKQPRRMHIGFGIPQWGWMPAPQRLPDGRVVTVPRWGFLGVRPVL